MEKKKRGSFTGEIGFVLAAAGSAVGLGNLWRFPYLAAQYGGGIFILVYIILALTFGFTLMTTEIAIGSVTNISPAPLCDVPASPLNIYTAGTTIIPARMAIPVSNISIWLTDFTMLTSSLVYEP